ncbi:MAG TPA: nucleotidyltransferase [Paludibacteraceae bacterium]|nr:nucleotidyltransferase [Paludibacteraceae bacterium]
MNITHPAHQEMLAALLENKVDFILVGGYAVIYHGYIRTTGDMDVWLRPSENNKTKLIKVFTQLKFNPDDISLIEKLDFSGTVIFHIGAEPDRIDFLTRVDGLNFEEAFNNRVFLKIDDNEIPILKLEDLITNKIITGRLKDKADIEQLNLIRERKK